jgi:redox-sensitive bicupin YhaK (pirin superfamily)
VPTIEPANVLELPVVPPAAGLRKKVVSVTTAPSALEGEGFPVRRAFFGADPRYLDPFVHMDQMGEVDYGPGEPKGTPWHPHRGFETVTYMIDGVFVHNDSTGGGGVITNGDTQWMTAGAGILHIERPPEELVVKGGLFHGVQLWVNLPRRLKWVPPRYQDIRSSRLALARSPDGGAIVRLIAGQLGDLKGPGVTYTPILLAHASVHPGALLELPIPAGFNSMAYVLLGKGTINGVRAATGQLVVFGEGDFVSVRADTRLDSRTARYEVLLLAGQPLREPVVAYGPFVMNTKEEIAQAFEDYRAGRLGTVPASTLT